MTKPIDEYKNTDEISDRIIELINKGEWITQEDRDELQDLAQSLLVVALVRSTGIDIDTAVVIVDKSGTLNISYRDGELSVTQTAEDYDEHDDSQIAVSIEERPS